MTKTVNLECHNWHTFEYGEGSDLSNIDVLASQQYCTTLNIIVILNFCQTPKGESIVLSFRGATHNLLSFYENQNYKNGATLLSYEGKIYVLRDLSKIP